MKHISILMLLILIGTISSHSQELNQTKIPEFKFENLLKIKNSQKLSEIADSVRYIPLETKENCLISAVAKYYFFKNLIFVCERNYVLKFTAQGRFIKQIGKPGRGPGEISSIRTMTIVPDRELICLYDAAMKKLLHFNFDGNLLNTISISSLQNVFALEGKKYIAQDQGIGQAEKYTFLLIKESGDTISTILNKSSWINNTGRYYLLGMPSFKPFYIYNGKPNLKTPYIDTVYTISEDKIIPKYIINIGKYRLPEEKMVEMFTHDFQTIKDSFTNYYYSNIIETANEIFLKTWSFGEGPSNIFIINKKDYSGISSGPILNDYDGGPFFWPDGSVNDEEIYTSFNSLNLINSYNQTKMISSKVKYPEKNKQLLDLMLKLKPTDNPVLMIVKLKPEYL